MLPTQYLAGATMALVVGTMPAAIASAFTATLEGDQVVSPNFPDGVPSNASGFATFDLSEDETALTYEILLEGVVLKPDASDRVAANDVTKIHIHQGERGDNGPHGLNIFGLPSEDDADLVVDYDNGVLTGQWTDLDAFDGDGALFDPSSPGTTKQLSTVLEALKAGELYVQVHTNDFDGLELRGQITPVPEPTALLGLTAIAGLGLYCRRWKA